MNIKLSLAAIACTLLGNTGVQAQAGLKKSDRQYDQWAYIESTHIYEKVLKRGYSSRDLLEKLGNAYYFNARYTEANQHYERLFSEFGQEELATEYYYRYAQTLQHTGDEAKSKQYYDLFVSKAGGVSQISGFRKNESELEKQIQANSGRYAELLNLPINTPYADYGSFVHEGMLYFTSARDTGSVAKKVHTWTGDAFTNLYSYSLSANAKEKQKVQRLKGDVKSMLNESTAVITKDGQTMYFTRNNILNNTRRYDASKSTRLKIYRAQLVDGKWKNVEELPFNGDSFNTAHPVLSQDEKLLYFVSDRPGGFGSSDLWRIAIHDNGTFGGPENLGPDINTEARETFPFITANDELYFSSDGRVGLGGLDVYAVKAKPDGSFGEIENIGAPVNSNADDFAYYIDPATKKGFFSSNREGGNGNDDIYSFTEQRSLQLECVQELLITVVDSKMGTIIADASLTLYDNLYMELGTSDQYMDSGYRFNTEYTCGETYRVKVSKDGYITKEEVFKLDNRTGVSERTIVLEHKKTEVKKNDDLFKVLNLEPIYFDYDKDHIRPDAAIELAKVLAVLEEYPTMKIDVRSHTDSRGSDSYNLKLSERRAHSTAAWITSQGIDASRVIYKGYGETQLVNGCRNGADCSDEQHEQNRRSEFIVMEL